ncbi:50S ribosomal protein L30 [Arthrobacter psychrolactophilus]|uniref:Large ribosomal subunit protein uL30 n=1 Tax=Arthrobacter psychrolactophilus TaxID=92442 RepID=A0A2V5J0Q1_9MICC|nr:50S ribosomal protein L30 [Arthrobacter psychrolactophilus]PYI40363.1 50S ribosomal protein L30 [Arthrobacter psychrolactophilus]
MTTPKNVQVSEKNLEITQVRGVVGAKQFQKDTLRSLGLKRIGHTVVRSADAVTVGMVNKVPHLIKVEETK